MKNNIPAHAQKVFEGIIFDVHQWQQEMFDGSTATFELASRPSVVVTLPVVGDKILVVREEQPGRPPYLSAPAGFSEKQDVDALSTGKRELLEETGLTSDDWELFDTYELYPRMSVTDYVYIARDCKKTHEKTLDRGERPLEDLWLTLDEFIDLVDRPDFASLFMKHHLIRAKYDLEYREILRNKIFGYEKN